jgi:hypothetical protein
MEDNDDFIGNFATFIPACPSTTIFFSEGGVGQTKACMPAYAGILRISQMI